MGAWVLASPVSVTLTRAQRRAALRGVMIGRVGQPSEDQRAVLDREFVKDYPVKKLTPHPRNARVHHRASKQESLEANTQYAPILVQRSTGYIITGNGTYKVAVEDLGWTTLDVILLDVDDEQAGRIALADNVTGDHSDYDNEALAAWLADYAETPGGLLGTGYELADYEALIADLADAAPDAVAALASPLPASPVEHDEQPDDEPEQAEEPEPAEVVLEFADAADVAEFGRMVDAVAETLKEVISPAEAALRALTLFVSVLDHQDEDHKVDMAELLRRAGVT